MKIESIKYHLQAYSIMRKRQPTINHAFASAIAPNDNYDQKIVKEAIKMIGQDPEKDLFCVYCGEPAETWDHVFGLVKNHQFSGYGHVIGNLLPCCKKCNSEKGNKNWQDFIKTKIISGGRLKILSQYFNKYLPSIIDYDHIKSACPNEINKLETIKDKIFQLIEEADIIAAKVRQKIKEL
ncbi:MAG: hypothetical protein HZA36_00710 [Parcubacteria group bacterium]|nr:hypothetical protein [Parcubacteria group bacterium]